MAFKAVQDPAFLKAAEILIQVVAAKALIIIGIKLHGSYPHIFHEDPIDPRLVISFSLYKSNNMNKPNRVGNGHIHDDGTGHVNFRFKFKEYRDIKGTEYKPPAGRLKILMPL